MSGYRDQVTSALRAAGCHILDTLFTTIEECSDTHDIEAIDAHTIRFRHRASGGEYQHQFGPRPASNSQAEHLLYMRQEADRLREAIGLPPLSD